jgi:hypothetical protein
LAGWTVNLLNSSGNVAASAVTDSSGNYAFSNVFPGTLTIAEVLKSGWTQTQPVNPPVYTVTTQSGQNVSGLLFGDHQSSASKSPATMVNGQASYAQTSTRSTASGGLSSGSLNVVLNNLAEEGNHMHAGGVLSAAQGTSLPLRSEGPNTSAGGGTSLGTLEFSGSNGSSGSKKGSSTGRAGGSTRAVSVSGVTQASALTVMYHAAAAGKGGSSSTESLIDLALSQNGNGSTKKDNADVITSLALNLLSGKKVLA